MNLGSECAVYYFEQAVTCYAEAKAEPYHEAGTCRVGRMWREAEGFRSTALNQKTRRLVVV